MSHIVSSSVIPCLVEFPGHGDEAVRALVSLSTDLYNPMGYSQQVATVFLGRHRRVVGHNGTMLIAIDKSDESGRVRLLFVVTEGAMNDQLGEIVLTGKATSHWEVVRES